MAAEHSMSWYEASLSAHERKRRGHFSTPPLLVERILDACAYTSTRDLTALRVLDPACGSGNFLIGAARRLLACCLQQTDAQKDPQELYKATRQAIQRNLWGLDTDPVACCMAQMGLNAVATELLETIRPVRHAIPFHIHQADGLVVPWGDYEGVDLFLANPPYLAAKNSDLSGYRSAQRRGQTDYYLLFLELALQIVRPGGWLALVLPDPLLARINASRERRRLLTETTVQQLWHLSGVFAAHVGAVVLVAQKRPPEPHHTITWVRQYWHAYQERTQPPTQTVVQCLLSQQSHAELRYLLGASRTSLPVRLHTSLSTAADIELERNCTPLGKLVTVHRGEELGKECEALLNKRPTDGADGAEYYSVLRGGSELCPYALAKSQCWLRREQITKPLERYAAPKLLVIKSTEWLHAALDLQGVVVLQTLYLLRWRKSENILADDMSASELDELYFLMALLNSRVLREYVYVLYTAYKWVQPQIEQHVLEQLPIPALEPAAKKPIIERAKVLALHAQELVKQRFGKKQQVLGNYDARVPGGDMITRSDGDAGLISHHQKSYWVVYEEQERAIRALYETILQHADKGVFYYG
jgi:methylase of polypeptide subunit release factors